MTAAAQLDYRKEAITPGTAMPVDDERLVERARAGDRSAWEALIQRYEHRIYALAYRMLGNAEDAADVTQEAFIRAYRKLGDTRDQLHFSGWIYRIATNACLDLLRRRKRFRWQPWDPIRHEKLLRQSRFDDPERVAMDGQERTEIQEVLSSMPPHYRMALLLREYEGLSSREIGDAMGLSVSAVKSLVFRARNEFRRLYTSRFGAGSPA